MNHTWFCWVFFQMRKLRLQNAEQYPGSQNKRGRTQMNIFIDYRLKILPPEHNNCPLPPRLGHHETYTVCSQAEKRLWLSIFHSFSVLPKIRTGMSSRSLSISKTKYLNKTEPVLNLCMSLLTSLAFPLIIFQPSCRVKTHLCKLDTCVENSTPKRGY